MTKFKRFERNRRFLVAILVAAIYQTPRLTPRELFLSARMLLRSLLWRGPKVDRWIYYRRLRHCFKCPVFFAPLRTCGSPFMAGYEDQGCYCAMERKAADTTATCWADDETDLDIGWKSNGDLLRQGCPPAL